MEEQQRDFIVFPSHSFGLMPQEERLEIPNRSCKLSISVPKETALLENRISLVPEAVSLLVNAGHRVIVENEAGLAAHYTNNQYSEAGAEIAYETAVVFQADVVIKVAPATVSEVELMRGKQVLLSSLNLAGLSDAYFRLLSGKRITALAYEYIKDRDGNYPVIRAMSEIAGNTSILIAAEYLSHPDYGRGLMFGGLSGISPTEVVILGAG
ncbi:MAG: alanine dehydrogenase, partial [Bacteroidetes bacterium HGW-Bacteroidetes-9]